MGDLGCGSVGEGFLHAPMAVLDERDSPWFQTIYWLFIVENGCIPTSQGGPEIKYLLQGGMSENRSLLTKHSGSLDNH